MLRVCKACDWISTQFRLALLEGDRDKAVAMHATGNLNITCPFANVKGEEFYPVHCAVMGGSIELLRWLVEDNCCPIKSVRVSGRSQNTAGKFTPVVTSRGKSLLGIALENCNVHIVRYLVVKKGISLYGESDITPSMLIRNLDAVLRLVPEGVSVPVATTPTAVDDVAATDLSGVVPIVPNGSSMADARSLSEEARDFGAVAQKSRYEQEEIQYEECIICFDHKIDCVATPCGHQICCLNCSKNIARCPVCSAECSFMRVFKP